MGNVIESQMEETGKQQIVFDKFFYWRYDDGQYGTTLYDTETGMTDRCRTYGNKSNLQWAISKHQKTGAEPVELSFDSGITKSLNKAHVIEASMGGTDALKDGFLEIQKMFLDYAKDGSQKEILSLFSLILSGYIARMYFHSQKGSRLYFSRAPIVLVRKNNVDLCGGYEHLERLVRSLVIDTGYGPGFTMKNPPIVPSKKRVNNIERCAYARLIVDEGKHCFPTQYRDTSVLIHSSFFRDDAIRVFVERNKWCTALLFNKSKSEWAHLYAEVDLNNMALPMWDWKPKKIHRLMNGYVLWLSTMKGNENFEKYLKVWKRAAKEVVYAYNLASVSTGRKIKQGSEWDMACLQITAVYSFLEYLYQEEILDGESCDGLFDEWANELLPGSRSQEIFNKSNERKHYQEEERDAKVFSEFEDLIRYIVDYEKGSKVYPLSKGVPYKVDTTNGENHDLDLEKDPWAFVTISENENIPIMKIRYKEIFKLAEKLNLLNETQGKQKILIETLESVRKSRGNQSYIQATSRVWLNISGKGAGLPGVTLIIDKMEFLDESIRKQLVAKISAVY